jgi:hypothetical protein
MTLEKFFEFCEYASEKRMICISYFIFENGEVLNEKIDEIKIKFDNILYQLDSIRYKIVNLILSDKLDANFNIELPGFEFHVSYLELQICLELPDFCEN